MKTTKMLAILVMALCLATEVANADFIFGTPTNLGVIVNSSARESRPTISSNGLELYFSSERPGGLGERDLWLAMRRTIDEAWGEPVNVGPTVNTSSREDGPRLSADDLSRFFK